MAELTAELRSKVASSAGASFTIREIRGKALTFENVYFKDRSFDLYCEFLSEDEILDVAKLLKEIFDECPKLARLTEPTIMLNHPSESYSDFVRAVLSVPGSALHKLLLLTSGRHLSWKMNVAQVNALALAKQDVCSIEKIADRDESHFRSLKQLYILPGMSSVTVALGGLPVISSLTTKSVEDTVRLMAFISNNSEMTFSEHLKLDFADAVATDNILPFGGMIDSIQRLLKSPYKTLAESMKAKDLTAFSSFMTKSVQEGSFPESILRNRAAAVASSSSFDPYLSVIASVSSFLSDEETSSLFPDDFEDDLNIHIVRAKIGADTPLIVYAALAEVLAVKGVNKAFEVAREMHHFNSQKEFDLKHYEATVALMNEALNPENDDFPFSWYSQLSEHAWVVSSHIQRKSDYELKV